MIDLRVKGLPDRIFVGGSPFLIQTDFRVWIEFSEQLKNKTIESIDFLFVDKVPLVPCTNELIDFYVNKNSTPSGENSGEIVIDYVQDGEFIVGSFMSAYGIDLTQVDMHWHLFKALLISLPSNTKMSEIIGHRSYTKTTEKYEQSCERLKRSWALPRINTDDEKSILEEINAEFYNA